MSDIVLSAGVRQNLLSLQNTAHLMSITQNRLATGKKVNTALDNPTNFFTSAALNSRAGDLGALLDSMSNGIKTLEAADNGITAIAKTIEQMQSTLRQARQDKSFKPTSYSIDPSATGNLSFSGGSIGSAPVNIGLQAMTPGSVTRSTVTAGADYVPPTPAVPGTPSSITATNTFTNINLSNNADNEFSFDVTLGGDTVSITLTQADAGGDNIVDIDEAIAAIQTQLDAYNAGAGLGVTVGKDGAGTRLTFTADAPGATALTVDNGAATGTGVTATVADLGIANLGGVGETDTGTANQPAVDRIITITTAAGTTGNIVLTSANAATAAAARITIQNAINAVPGLNGTITVGGTGNRIDLSGATDGSNSITVGGADVDDVFGAGRTVVGGIVGTPDRVKTVDELVAEINTTLSGQVRASNDNGRLRIENLSTTALDLAGYNNTTGVIDGSVGATSINGNDVRVNFAKQFNGYIDQLNKLADDASFNGVNLLRGDKLKITFNEAGTSTIEIQSKDASGNANPINTSTLGILQVMNAEFDSDDQIDARLNILGDALATLRAQGSAFGSNLSIVQNRQDFTKAMINTLQTGADNLVLADSNEEGANMLALQTRQQLSTTALSLSAQADQAVLRLFG